MSDMKPFYPLSPKQAQRYVDAIGIEAAIDLFLNLGGSEVFLSIDPKGRGIVERLVGYHHAKTLAAASDDLKIRVPLANAWLARCLYAQGLSVAVISRRLRCADSTVHRYLAGQNDKRTS